MNLLRLIEDYLINQLF